MSVRDVAAQSVGAPQAGASFSQKYEFDIAPGELGGALANWSRATKLKFGAPGETLKGLRTAGVQGARTAEDALRQLLAGTHLSFSITGKRTVTIFDPSAARSAHAQVPLDQINVEAPREEGSRTQNAGRSNLTPVFPGGQVATGSRVGVLGNTDFMNTPFNTTSYTSKIVEDKQAKTLADVFTSDPSVRTYGSRAYDNFLVRGFRLFRGDAAFGGMYGLTNILGNELYNIERVEILKGPNALLGGVPPTGSIAGAINLVPKRATDTPVNNVTGAYMSDANFGGHYDFGHRFGANKEWGARINLAHRQGDTNRDNESERVDFATAAFDYRGNRFRASFDIGYDYKKTNGSQYTIGVDAALTSVPGAPNGRTNIFMPWQFDATKHRYAVAKAEFDITESWTISGGIGQSQTVWDAVWGNNRFVSTSGDLSMSTGAFQTKSDFNSAQLALRGEVQTGPITHKPSFGYDAIYNKVFDADAGITALSPNSNIYNPRTYAQPAINVPSKLTQTSQSAWESFAFADTISILNERVQVIVGGRYQSIAVDQFSSGFISSSYDKSALTPVYAVVVKPLENLSVYANYIEGLQRGAIAPKTSGGIPVRNADEILAPYVSKQKEVGVKYDAGKFAVTASLFEITMPSASFDSATQLFMVNGEQRNRGVELQVMGSVAEHVRVLGGVMLLDPILAKTQNNAFDGKTAPGVPDLQVNLGAELDIPQIAGLTLTGNVIYTSDQFVNNANTQSIPSWVRTDLGARYKVANTTWRAAVENVFDEGYWASGTNGGSLVLGRARTFLMSGTVHF